MDGENNGNPYFLMDDLGGPPLFLVQHPYWHFLMHTRLGDLDAQ